MIWGTRVGGSLVDDDPENASGHDEVSCAGVGSCSCCESGFVTEASHGSRFLRWLSLPPNSRSHALPLDQSERLQV